VRHPSFASVRRAATLVLLALTLSGAHSTAQVTTLPVTAGIAVAPPFTGIDPSSSNPPDLTIAAGLDRLVIGSNDVVVIRDKSGVLIASKDLRVLFASVRAPGEDTVFSPRVVFDPDSERFFLIAAAHNRPACVPTCVSHYLLAVSKSGTPATLDAADWHFDTLDASSDNTGTGPLATSNFADLPDIGVDEQVLVITSVQRDTATGDFVTAKIRRVLKVFAVDGINYTPSDWLDFVNINVPGTANRVRAVHPAAMSGGLSRFFLTSRVPGPASNDCSMVVWSLDNLVALTTLTGKVVTKTGGCAPSPAARQPGDPTTLQTSSAAGGHSARPVYRNGSLWDVESVQRTVSGEPVSAVRWMQINVGAWPATPTFVQDAFIATAGLDHFHPAIMADASNNAFIIYGRTSVAGEFASAYVTGRSAADPVNTLRAPALLQAGADALTVSNPAPSGQYFGAALDPADGTVWVVGKYVASASQWAATVANVSGSQRLTVTKSGNGTGTVTSAPAGISCPTDCTEFYDAGTSVTLTTTPAAGSFFTGWGGACGGVGTTCDVDMDQPRSVSAGFALQSVIKFSAAAYSTTEPASATTNATVSVTRAGGLHAGATVHFETVAEVGTGKATAGVDYEARSQTLTFLANQATVTTTVPIMPDTLAEGAETVKLLLTNATGGAVLGSPTEAKLTIQDNDQAGSIQFILPAYTVGEPAVTTTARITVTRTTGFASGVTVGFHTTDGTATAGLDYQAVTSTLTFAAGETTKFVDIPIFPDGRIEGDETIVLTLSNPGAPATLGVQKTAVLTIRDAQAGLQFSAPTYTVSEGTASATITVLRTGPLSGMATVSYSTSDGTATGGTDYTPTSGTLSFKAGDTTKSFTVPILNDAVVDGSKPETVLLLLSNFNGAGPGPLSSAVLTITDNDVAGSIKLGAATFSASEALGVATIAVSRSGGAAGSVTVNYATADQLCMSPPCAGQARAGLDYEKTIGTLTFGAGETTKTVLVPIFNDSLAEGAETFLFNLMSNPQSSAVLGSPTQAIVTILDNDQGGAIQFSAATYTATEALAATSTASITLTRTGAGLASGASVQFATSNGTAIAGIGYTATVTTLVFAAGETTKTVPIPILPAGASGDETVKLTLSNPAGGATLGARTTAVLTIVDAAKVVQFGAPTYTVTEGTAATITVVRGGPTAGSVTVPYTTTNGSATAPTDYVTKSGTLNFGPGIKSLSFTVTTVNTTSADGARTVLLSLGAPTGGAVLGTNATATLTIQDNDAPGTFQFGAATYGVVEGGLSPVMITRTGGSGGTVVVRWTATGGTATGGALPTTPGADYAPTTGLLTFGLAVTRQRVPLTIVNDPVAENPETVALEITEIVSSSVGAASIGAQSTSTLTIQDNDVGGTIEFMTTAVNVAENVVGGKATLTVKRTGTALAGGVLVDYAVTGAVPGDITPPGDVTPLSGTLTFAAGQASVPLQITIVNDFTPEPNKTLTVTLSNPRSTGPATGANKPKLGATTSATVTIVDEEPRLAFSAGAFSVAEGGSMLVPVVRTGPTTGTLMVDVTGVSGTATANTDFTVTPGTLIFGPGITKLNVTVAAPEDAAAEGAEQATLQLANPVNASLGALKTATLTIQDNESAGVIQFAAAALSAVEGRTARVTVTRTGTNLVGGVTVGWSKTGGTATSGADFSPTSGVLTFGAGVTSQSFDIVTVDDADAEGTETVVLSLGLPSSGATLGTPSALTLLIVDTEQSVAFRSITFSVGETVPQAVISVIRLGVPEGTAMVTAATVTASTAPVAVPGLDYTTVPPTVLTFGPGEILKTFSVPILTANALTRSGNRLVGLKLSSPTGVVLGAADTATLTILDFRPDLSSPR